MAVTSTSEARRDVVESVNPASGEVIGTAAVHSPDEVDAAVSRARTAARRWGALGFEGRRAELFSFRRALATRAEEIADLIHRENGKPLVDATNEVLGSLSHLHHAALRAEKVLRKKRVSPGLMANLRAEISYHPLGVVGVIGPWNYPMFTPFGSIAYALAAGNAVVFKPSELTPLVGVLLGEIARDSMNTENVFQVVTGYGETGAALARSSVDKIAFTGSPATGRRVMAAAAERLTPVLMELGGKDALIVSSDADLDRAAHDAVYGAMHNAGQTCVSIERCYVEDAVYEDFVEKVVAEAKSVRQGEHIGAITMPRQVEVIREHLEDAVAKGASVRLGGVQAIRGNFVEPTVLTEVTADMKVLREETFGPVLPIVRVGSTEEAIELANSTSYGLGSAIFGKARVRELADRIRAGMTSINSVLAFASVPSLPFGGIGDSGFGRIHGDEGLREFSRTKSTVEERFPLPMNVFSFKVPDNASQRMVAAIRQLYGNGPVSRVRDRLRH